MTGANRTRSAVNESRCGARRSRAKSTGDPCLIGADSSILSEILLTNHYESVGPGTLLITHPALEIPEFQDSVVLILDHTAQGTQGLMLNKPTGFTIEQSLKDLNPLWHPQDQLYYGGPVFKHWVFMLHTPDWRCTDTVDVCEDLCLTMASQAVPLLQDSHEPHYWRMFLGCTAWAPDQLEMEFERGRHWPQYGWLTADYPGTDWIFDRDSSSVYTTALSLGTHQAVNQWL